MTLAILKACAQGGQKWLILGNNGSVTQGPWTHHGNSLTPLITTISMGKHDSEPL